MRLIDHVAKLGDGAASHATGVATRRFAGRYVNLRATCDIVLLDGHLLRIFLESNDPVASLGELVAESEEQLRLVRARDGYSIEGEAYTFDFAADGSVARMRGDAAMSFWQEDEYDRQFLTGARVPLV